MKNEKTNKTLELIARDYSTTPDHICEILDKVIDRAWSEEAHLAGETRLQSFNEKPTAFEYFAFILSDAD